MIADSATGSGFGGAVGYITEKAQTEEESWTEWARQQVGAEQKVEAVQTRNILLDDHPDEAAEEMRITANQNSRVEKPRYSVSISYDPDDAPTDEDLMQDMKTFLDRRGLSEHQAVLAIHRDEDHAHIHATVNRVHPETGDLWRDSFDYYENMSALREIEQERGWTRPKRDDSRGRVADWKIRRFERTGEIPFGQEVAAQAGDHFADAKSWDQLQKALAEEGLQVQRKGSGGIVTDGEEEAPLSEVARKWSFNQLDSGFPDQFQTYERTQGPDRPRSAEANPAERGAGADQTGDPTPEQGGGGSGSDYYSGKREGGGGQGIGNGSGRAKGSDGSDDGKGQRRDPHGQEGSSHFRRQGASSVEDREDRGSGGRDEDENQEPDKSPSGDADSRGHTDASDLDADPLDWRGADVLGDDPNEKPERVESEGIITHRHRLSDTGKKVVDNLMNDRDRRAARIWREMSTEAQNKDLPHIGKMDRRRLKAALNELSSQGPSSEIQGRSQNRNQNQNQNESQSDDKGQSKDRGRSGGRGGR